MVILLKESYDCQSWTGEHYSNGHDISSLFSFHIQVTHLSIIDEPFIDPVLLSYFDLLVLPYMYAIDYE